MAVPSSTANDVCNVKQAPYCTAGAAKEVNGGGVASVVAGTTKAGGQRGCRDGYDSGGRQAVGSRRRDGSGKGKVGAVVDEGKQCRLATEALT